MLCHEQADCTDYLILHRTNEELASCRTDKEKKELESRASRRAERTPFHPKPNNSTVKSWNEARKWKKTLLQPRRQRAPPVRSKRMLPTVL